MQFRNRNFTDETVRYFDDHAEQWDAEHGPDSPRAADFFACVDYLARLCRELGRPRVLDVGCASGQHLLHLAPEIRAGVGVDIAPRMIERARAAAGRHGVFGHLRFQVGDARTLAREALGRFALVLFVGVLEHIPDRLGALRAAAGLLDAGGRLVVVMPNPRRPAACPPGPLRRPRPAPIFASDRHYTAPELAARGRRAGLVAERVDALPDPSDRGVPATAAWDTFAMRFRRDGGA
jgi:SAM-dependent methyltransferase